MSEPIPIMMYLHHFPDRTIEEVGWVNIAGKPGWGASPDGVIVLADGSRGALEIKTASDGDLSLKPHYIPQAFMEMMALDVKWCDLIKYGKQVHDDGTIVHRFMRYHIVRHKPTEQYLVGLISNAIKNKDRLGEVLASSDYVKARRFLQDLCDNVVFRAELKVNEDAIDAFMEFRYGPEQSKRVRLINSIKERTNDHFPMTRETIQAQMEAYKELLRTLT